MAITITLTGSYTLDESKNLQNTGTATTNEDNNDNDVAISSLPSEFYDFLYGSGAGQRDLDSISASYLSYPTSVGVAGSSTTTSLVHVTSDSGNISTLGLTNSTGGSFTGTAVAANDSGLTTTSGHQIYLLSAPVNGVANQVVLGLYDSDNDASHTLDAVAFAIYMKPDGALDADVNAQLWSVTFTPIDHPTNPGQDEAVDLLQNVYINSTGQLHIAFDNMPSSANLFNDAAESPSGGGIIVFGMNPHVSGSGKYDNSSDTIQTSQGGDGATIGVNNQMFNPGEGAYFTYVKDIDDRYLSGAKGGLSSTEADYQQNMQYASLIDASTASIRITQTQGNNDAGMRITANHLSTAYKGGDLITHRGDGKVDIDKVYVWDSTHTTLLESYTGSGPDDDGGSDTITIAVVNGVATVTGLDDGNIIEWHTTSPQNQVLIEDVAGAWDLGGFDIKEGASTTVSAANHAFLEDDGPSFSAPIADGYVHYTVDAADTHRTDTHSLNGDPGSDGFGAYAITSFTSSVTVNGISVIGAYTDSTHTAVNYFQDKAGGTTGTYDAGIDVLYYKLELVDTNADTTLDSYKFSVVNAPAAEDLKFTFESLPSGDNLFGTVAKTLDGPGIVVFGEHTDLKAGKYSNTSDVIATSQGGIDATIGVNNQMFDPGEGAYFTIVNNIADSFLSGFPNGLSQTEADYAANIQFAGYQEASSAKLGISQLQGNSLATVKLTAYELTTYRTGADLLSHSGTNGGSEVNIAHVIVYDSDGVTVLEDSNGSVNAPGITIDLSGNSAVISGLDAGDIIKFDTGNAATTFNQVLVEDPLANGGGGKWDVGFFAISQPQATPDHGIDFRVSLTDADGDALAAPTLHDGTGGLGIHIAIDGDPFSIA